jgi:hypothetical protein
LSFLTVLGLGFPQPASAEPAGVRAFLDRLIVYETHPEQSRDKDLKTFLAPRLAAEVRKDEGSTDADSPLPFMDFEPICQCQDGEGMKLYIRSIRGGDSAAIAMLESRIGGKVGHVSLQLTHGLHGWRIADISTHDEPSLLHDLEKYNRKD